MSENTFNINFIEYGDDSLSCSELPVTNEVKEEKCQYASVHWDKDAQQWIIKPCKRKRREPLPTALRSFVLNRDGNRCAACGSTEHLEIHHIIHKADGGEDIADNLITLCLKCHAEAHKNDSVYALMQSRIRHLYK